jgi:hypothetical protein
VTLRPWIERTFEFRLPVEGLSTLLERLRGTAARIEEKLRGVPVERLRHREGEGWSVLEHVGHLVDLDELHLARLDDYVARAPVLRPADPTNRRTWEAGHNARALAELLAELRAGRDVFVARLAAWDPARAGSGGAAPAPEGAHARRGPGLLRGRARRSAPGTHDRAPAKIPPVMPAARVPFAIQELERLLGREEPLDVVHSCVRRAAGAIRPVKESGAMLVTCSDEFQGEIRAAFERDVARLLTAPTIPAKRRVFSVANLGGRVEPGALVLAEQHFRTKSSQGGPKLLVLEIASHVGRRETTFHPVFGELDRFGQVSPCCGALRLLLDSPTSAQSVRHPWFDQLSTFFGPARLAALRADSSSYQMVRAALVHAVLQAETAIADLLREHPDDPTHVLVVPLVVVNQKGLDSAILVGVHQLLFEGQAVHIEIGHGLRSTPEALRIEREHGRLRVHSNADAPSRELERDPAARAEVLRALRPEHHAQARHESVRTHVARTRSHLATMHEHPNALRVYARPLLRAFVQGLSVLAPEVGLAALALEGASEWARARKLHGLLQKGPSGEEARHVLHDIEGELQQLGHREAQQVLEYLLAEESPLFGKR